MRARDPAGDGSRVANYFTGVICRFLYLIGVVLESPDPFWLFYRRHDIDCACGRLFFIAGPDDAGHTTGQLNA